MKVVLCNCSPGEARGIATALVEEGLAACVNVLPAVTSYYVWEGRMQEDGETTLLIKTSDEQVRAMSERIHHLHSYDTPEIVVLDVDVELSDSDYVAWVRSATRSPA